MRITCFGSNTPDRPIAELELRHRLRTRAEDRIRAPGPPACATCPSTRQRSLQRGWLEIVQIALDLLAWKPVLALAEHGPSPGTPPPAVPPVLRGRPAHHHRPPKNSLARQALALDWRDHRRFRTAHAPAQPQLTGEAHRPHDNITRRDSRGAVPPAISSGKRKGSRLRRQAPTKDQTKGPQSGESTRTFGPLCRVRQPHTVCPTRAMTARTARTRVALHVASAPGPAAAASTSKRHEVST